MRATPISGAGASPGSLRSYATGFAFSLLLTAIGFGFAIKRGGLPHWAVLSGILGAAAAQMLVHLHYFLHLDRSSRARWNMMALIFALLIIGLFAGGSLWIMFSLNARMN